LEMPWLIRRCRSSRMRPGEDAEAQGGRSAMIETAREALWRQFGASIDMLENAMSACPEALWSDRTRRPESWYVVYHALFWLDLYLSGSVEGFAPPAPFTLDELDPAGVVPERAYSQAELRAYLVHCRTKCREAIASLTEEASMKRCRLPWGEVSFLELLLDNMRHVQHHAGQLHLVLREAIDDSPRWVARARRGLPGRGRTGDSGVRGGVA